MSTLVPASQAIAAPTPEVQACLAPISDPDRAADVKQGWIDGCRRDGRL